MKKLITILVVISISLVFATGNTFAAKYDGITVSDEGVQALEWWQTKISDSKTTGETLQRVVNNAMDNLIIDCRREKIDEITNTKTISEIEAYNK